MRDPTVIFKVRVWCCLYLDWYDMSVIQNQSRTDLQLGEEVLLLQTNPPNLKFSSLLTTLKVSHLKLVCKSTPRGCRCPLPDPAIWRQYYPQLLVISHYSLLPFLCAAGRLIGVHAQAKVSQINSNRLFNLGYPRWFCLSNSSVRTVGQ